MSQLGGGGHMQGGGALHSFERVAALGVAAAWTRRAHARRAAQQGGAAPANLLDDPQYPQSWDEYLGQEPAKAMIQAALTRARERNEPMRHVLIANGEPGIGKTAMGVLIARSLGGRCFTISGTPNYQQVRTLILGMRPGDVLFIDEVHRLVQGGKGKAEWLLHVLQDDALIGPTGIEKAHLGIVVVAATTDVGRLPRTIIERFKVRPTLVPLSHDEAYKIAFAYARRLFPPKPWPAIADMTRIIMAADYNPRKIKALLDSCLDAHYTADGYDLDTVLAQVGMTDDGLDWDAQRYLVFLRRSSGPIGESQIVNLLQIDKGAINYMERGLSDKNLIEFTRSGRQLTADGIARADELISGGVSL